MNTESMSIVEVDKLLPGRELDALIAEKVFHRDIVWINDTVFGPTPYIWDKLAKRIDDHVTQASLLGGSWIKSKTPEGEEIEFFGRPVPHWSEFISLAWEIIDKFKYVTIWRTPTGDDLWGVRFYGYFEACAYSESLPLAICRAALKGVT